MIRVIDIFAGPGGLSEGFSSIVNSQNEKLFDVVLSVEKEQFAFQTLRIRTFFRQFNGQVHEDYYRYMRGAITLGELFSNFPEEEKEVDRRCLRIELGKDRETVLLTRSRINEALGKDSNFVLIGGPPCQAYSLAGRSRISGNPDYDETKDRRHTLYIEYLQILADHRPAVFVMENVKGLLSAEYQKKRIFYRILDDLKRPATALKREERDFQGDEEVEYNIYGLSDGRMLEGNDVSAAVIRSENYGIPQARHRVILLGIRKDLTFDRVPVLIPQEKVPVSKVISMFPRIRSGLSKEADCSENWVLALTSQTESRWVDSRKNTLDGEELSKFIRKNLAKVEKLRYDRGDRFLPVTVGSDYLEDWYCDSEIGGICDHDSRSHIREDLYRYFFAACFAIFHSRSPKLSDFPKEILPQHKNVKKAVEGKGDFSDRFRVQISDRPGTTVVSHISKDGHYYIHPDPLQCRSLTVREAARIQTFPDNYHFYGNRTAQYVQVGNAVPPLLARQIGELVLNIIDQAGIRHFD